MVIRYLSAIKIASILLFLILTFTNQINAGLFSPIKSLGASSLVDKITSAPGVIKDKTVNVTGDALDTVKNTGDKVVNATGKTAELVKNTTVDTLKSFDGYVEYVKDNIELNCLGFPKGPFSAAFESALSSTTGVDDIRFYFASRKKSNYPTIKVRHFTLQDTDFDISKDTFVLTHGFMSHGRESWLKNMTKALLQYKDVNIFITDWQKGSNVFNYVSAVATTKLVGEEIAELMKTLKEASPPNAKRGKIHLIGHSLGAHISGRGAYVIKENERNSSNPWIVDRITGLDPAQPCFQTKDAALKLTPDDAPYIDIIHTNARTLLFFGLGLSERLGFVDFYPNGGKGQPGCFDLDPSLWNTILLPQKVIQDAICSHGRSYIYFTESIINAVNKNCRFIGHEWDLEYENVERLIDTNCSTNELCPEMGYDSIKDFPRNKGVYFVPTGDDLPHCHINENDKEKIAKHIKLDDLRDNDVIRYAKELIVGS